MGTNSKLIKAFETIADLLEIQGADRFRSNSYRRAARAIDDLTEDVDTLAAEGRLATVEGIGKGTAEKIHEFLEHGTIAMLAELQAAFPAGITDLLEIPGMGPKKVAAVYEQLQVGSLDDLKRVVESGELAALAGFGKASVAKIKEGIDFLEKRGGRVLIGTAMPIAEAMAEQLRKMAGVKRVAYAGSLRRGQETIGDVDLLCEGDNGKEIVTAFTKQAKVKRVLAAGDTKGSIAVNHDEGGELQIDIRVVPKESFGAALQYFTGSKEHNVHLREMAVKRGWKLNEYGLYDGDGKQLAGEDEKGIYQAFGLPWIPPELRQDRTEWNLTDTPALVTVEEIRCDLHMHTVASDGRNTIEEMARSAKDRGYTHIAICDHSKSSVIANGLTIERMEAHIEEIRRVNDTVDGITILAGTECDILPDGSLDYPDDLLAACDWVVASIHVAQGSKGGKKGTLSPTERTLSAMENRYVCAIGHPTGRLINRRAAMEMDIEEVIAAAVRTHTFLEINASPHRLDLKDTHVRAALEAGALLTINTDAHVTYGMDMMRYGVLTARRGWATGKSIVNCLSLKELLKAIQKKRGA